MNELRLDLNRILVLFVIAAALATSTACQLLGPSEEEAACRKMAGLGGKDSYTPTETDISLCTWKLEDQKNLNPKVYGCFKKCIDEAKDFDSINPCFSSCEMSGGAGGVKASVKVDTKSIPAGVAFKVKTKAKAKVEISLKQTYGDAIGPKKATASKKGQAKIVFKEVPRGTYEAEITVTQGEKLTRLTEQVVLDAALVEYSGASPSSGASGTDCDLSLDKPRLETVRPSNKLETGNGKLTLKFAVAGGKTLRVGSESATFAKNKASVTLDLGGRIGDLPASVAGASTPRVSFPFDVDAKDVKLTGTLSCSVAIPPGLVVPYKGQPITFSGDSERGNRATILIKYGKVDRVLVESSAKLKDVDYVAVSETKEKKLPSCPYYDPNTNSNVRVDRTRYDIDVVIYDRRTGKKLKSKGFAARNPGCPAYLTPGSSISEFADSTKAEEWIEATVKAFK